MGFVVLPDETLEDLQLNGLFILQKKDSFRFGMDAVLLSSFVTAKKNHSVLDLGTGTGIIPILLSAKTEVRKITGLEIQSEIADMAQRSVDGNNLGSLIDIVKGDIRQAISIFGRGSYDVVVTNPPYISNGSGLVNPVDTKAISRHEIYCTLDDILKISAALLKPKGEFFMVHRPERLTDILEGMRKVNLEPKILRLVCARAGKEPSLILVKGLKNGNPGIKILPVLFIYDENGDYTKEARIQYSMDK
ncbi:MAG: tRNA1(Val) (adenine(37)-N6)-methyltransferase [Clostridiaceae bacterium]|jgi:tRNA1Val (adenine37-N6)-methyltransferase|nr:tRNA1(Val) (adenine(37)-N6)-methyltransferase [Clostridiaceae bacterium]